MISVTDVKQNEVVIFGTGFHAARCMYYLHEREIKVSYFLNNHAEVEEFCGLPVYSPNEKNVEKVYILVACLEQTYREIAKQLNEYGLQEFAEYIYYGWLDKKMILLHGNCHMLVIKEYLHSSEEFCQKYAIYPNPLIHENREGRIRENTLLNCDVWIHEDIREDNEYGYELSDSGIRENINRNVIEIVIPHLFGLGKVLFPQAENGNKRNGAIANGKDFNGIFPFTDRVIENCYVEGKTPDEIIQICNGDESISEREIMDNFSYYMDKIRNREHSWDIKIYQFIRDNYKKYKLFYDPGHPTNVIFKHISLEILDKLGVDDTNIDTERCLDAHEMPVYPAVRKTLRLIWQEDLIRQGDTAKALNQKVSFEEYIKEYIWWCYESKKGKQ